MDFIWIIILFILGLLMVLKPIVLWKIEHFFTVKDGEPTDLYVSLMRLGGVVFMVASVICAIYILFQ